MISPEVMGTLQYAGVHLRTPLFVVPGHERCGADDAATCREAARCGKSPLAQDEALRMAVEANVRWSMRQLMETPEAKARLAEGKTKLVGGVYELESGRVRFLP